MIEDQIRDTIRKKHTPIWAYLVFGVLFGFTTTLFQELSNFDQWPKFVQHAIRFINLMIVMMISLLTRGSDGRIHLIKESNTRFTKRFLVSILGSLLGAFVAYGIDQNFGDY